MTSVEIVSTTAAPGAIGPYSQAIVHGGLVLTSGQIGMDPESGEMVSGGVVEQTRQVLANLAAVLEAGGSSLDLVIKTTVFLRDMDDFVAMNGIYAEAFGAARPARATVAVSGLPKGALVEIEATARTR
ncbi:MAG: 2-iminobutanoate/2-iminopropanoate deaminase [Pseudohongiellaceae bacterium]|jgi:2-iminobutanoate/2-iminopropanoate deaminase